MCFFSFRQISSKSKKRDGTSGTAWNLVDERRESECLFGQAGTIDGCMAWQKSI